MFFPTMTFFLFFVVVFGVSWRLRPHLHTWKLFILAASYVFYGWWDWRFCFLLAASTVGNVVAAQRVAAARDATSAKRILIAGVTFNLVLLGAFKYYGFFVESLVAMLDPVGLAPTGLLIEIALPVGISFFTFCGLSYLIDVYRGHVEVAAPIDIAVYLAFFPHLVAGPIVRAGEFVPQLQRPPRSDSVDVTRGVRLIMRGLVKKVVIANFLAQTLADPVFGAPRSFGAFDLWAGAYAYAVQIYADFSGYTDIAIGTALLLGIKFPDNFNRPYTAATLQDFWRRWHMTLSRWLRDYLYIPLGGNRGGTGAEYRNLVITMALGGLWHGARWTFVAWGLYHGVGLVIERAAMERRDRPPDERSPRVEAIRSQLGLATSHGDVPHLGAAATIAGDTLAGDTIAGDTIAGDTVVPPERRRQNPWLGRLLTFHFVVVGWVLFRAETFTDAWDYLRGMVTAGTSSSEVTWLAVIAIAVSLAAQFVPTKVGLMLEWRASRLPPIAQGVGFGLFLVVLDILGPQGVAPFIYFQF